MALTRDGRTLFVSNLMEYTAVGDPVNLASRIEAMTRQHQVDILITQFTYELVKYDIDAEPLGTTSVRGRSDPIAIYRVVGLKSTPQIAPGLVTAEGRPPGSEAGAGGGP